MANVRLVAALQGNLGKIIGKQYREMRPVIAGGLREAGRGLQKELKAHTRQAGLGKFANRWAFRVNRPKTPWKMSVAVFPRGQATRKILSAYETGAVIRPTGGNKFLAIPTQWNRASGRRGAKRIFTTRQLRDTGQSFTRKGKDGRLIVFARVRKQTVENNGRKKSQALVGGHLLGSGRGRRTRDILKSGAVPMFTLLPFLTFQKKLNIAAYKQKWQRRLPEYLVKHLNEKERGNGR